MGHLAVGGEQNRANGRVTIEFYQVAGNTTSNANVAQSLTDK